MGRKSRTKKERRAQREYTKKTPLKWEDLVTLKDETITHMLTSQQMIGAIFQEYGKEGELSKDIRESVLGMMKTYQDVIPRLQDIMKLHAEECNEKEDGSVEFKFKSGNIDEDGDDVFVAMEIANKYNEVTEVIADITSVGYTDLFAKLKTINPDIDTSAVEKIDQANTEGKLAVVQEQLKLAMLTPGGEDLIKNVATVAKEEQGE